MTKFQTRRTGTGYKAGVARGTRQWTGTPDCHSDATTVDPAGPGRRSRVLPWEVSSPVRAIRTTGPETAREGRGEVSRGHSTRDSLGEGPNPLTQGAV